MATYIQPQIAVEPSAMRRIPSLRVPIAWAAIFAGLVGGLATNVLLILLGSAIGFTVLQVGAAGVEFPPMTVWSTIWIALSMLLAAFVGGFVAAKASDRRRKIDGMLHGFVTWGLTTILYAVLSFTAVSALFGGIFAMVTQPVQAQMEEGEPVFQQMVKGLASVTGINLEALGPDSLATLRSQIEAGNHEGAVNLLQNELNINQATAAGIVDFAFVFISEAKAAPPQAQQRISGAVDSAAEMAAGATWVLLSVIILSLAISLWGGVMGARYRQPIEKNPPDSQPHSQLHSPPDSSPRGL